MKVDEALAAQHTIARPQCAACKESRVAPILEGKSKKCKNAPDARRKQAEAAARLESERKKARLPVPARKAKYLVDKIVGKAKQGKARKVFWKEEDSGALCSTAACTWTPPTDFDGDSGKLIPKEILGKSITIEEQGVIHEATVAADKVRAVQPTSFFVTYTKNVTTGKPSRKKARWVDFELPAAEKTSWWRLAGYGTESSTSSESSDDEESKGVDTESEMEIDD